MWDLQKHFDNIAIIQESGGVVTYGELEQFTTKLSEKIPERCLVFCFCRNSMASLIGYVAFLNSRVVPLMLEESINRELLDSLIEAYQPAYLWISSEMIVHFDGWYPIYSNFEYTLIKNKSDQITPLYQELALLITTSGSTGSRKLVRQSYKNIKSNTNSIIEYLEIDRQQRAITTLPMSYTYGLSIINSYLQAGASIILTSRSLVQKEFWSQFKAYNATSFGGVPFTYEVLKKLKIFGMDLPSLKVMTQAGGRLTSDLHEKYSTYANNTGRRFYVMYGQTEATARMTYLPYEASCEKCGSIGIAIPNGELFLIDEEENKINDVDTVGELGYKGENVSLGYANGHKDLMKGDDNQGVLLTGDLAKRDSEGFYWLVGRKNRYLKLFGSRVNLDEIEELLKVRFGDDEIACGGGDDNIRIYVTDNNIVSEIIQYLTDKTGLNRKSFSVKKVDEILKNESGKTNYATLAGLS